MQFISKFESQFAHVPSLLSFLVMSSLASTSLADEPNKDDGQASEPGHFVRTININDFNGKLMCKSFEFILHKPECDFSRCSEIKVAHVVAFSSKSFEGKVMNRERFKNLPQSKYLRGYCFYSDIEFDRSLIEDLSRVKGISYLMIGANNISDKDVAKLLKNSSISCLILTNASNVQNFLQISSPNKSIEILAIQNATLGALGASALMNWSNLSQLNLKGTHFTSKETKIISSLDKLTALILQSSSVDDDSFAELLNSKTIKHLDVSHTAVTGGGLRDHANDSIESADFSNTKFLDDSVGLLKNLRSLRTIDLSSTQITSNSLGAISSLKNLQELSLAESQIGLRRMVDDSGVKSLSNLRGLKRLNLSQSRLTVKGLIYLSQMPNLERLTIDRTSLSDESVPVLSNMKNLKYLSLVQSNISDAGMMKLRGALPHCEIR